MPSIDLAGLREAVASGRYLTTQHAKQRIGLRRITDDDIQRVVAAGDVIEEHRESRPFPKCLIMAQVGGEPCT